MPTTSSSRRLRRASALAAALSAVVLSAGCSLLPGAHAAPTAGEPSSASDAASATAPAPVTTAVGDLVQEADYGTQTTGVSTKSSVDVTLTGVHRLSDDFGIVTARIMASDGDAMTVDTFREMGTDGWNSSVFSGVSIQVSGDPTIYRTLRTDSADDGEDGRCLCSSVPALWEGTPTYVWAYVTLAKGATTVDVVVPTLQPWAGVPVS